MPLPTAQAADGRPSVLPPFASERQRGLGRRVWGEVAGRKKAVGSGRAQKSERGGAMVLGRLSNEVAAAARELAVESGGFQMAGATRRTDGLPTTLEQAAAWLTQG